MAMSSRVITILIGFLAVMTIASHNLSDIQLPDYVDTDLEVYVVDCDVISENIPSGYHEVIFLKDFGKDKKLCVVIFATKTMRTTEIDCDNVKEIILKLKTLIKKLSFLDHIMDRSNCRLQFYKHNLLKNLSKLNAFLLQCVGHPYARLSKEFRLNTYVKTAVSPRIVDWVTYEA
uniref:B7R n=1 Tax=Parastrongyloides trichosuri TaxID=131310 RepID=A0A0N4ZXI0_PARTI